MKSTSDMTVGIFAKTFPRATPEENANAVTVAGFRVVHYNLACAGLASMPERIDPAAIDAARRALARRSITVVGLSGTFNMIHPDLRQRREGVRRLTELARYTHALGTSVVTLCTGTRDAEDMWRGHPDNASPEAWRDLRQSMEQALAIAEEADVTLAIEPETANVVDSAAKARRLLDEMASARLKIILDPANLFLPASRHRMAEVLDEFFDLLGEDIVQAHAKDVLFQNDEVVHVAAGTGVLDYGAYIDRLAKLRRPVPLILHGLAEGEVRGSRAFVNAHLYQATRMVSFCAEV
jgi:sugar phosphate isomerase/epimerase